MIKLILANEEPPQPERVVRFELRRHKQAETTTSVEQYAYLVGREPVHGAFAADQFPIKIDGRTKTVEVRVRSFERLGFRVVVQHDK